MEKKKLGQDCAFPADARTMTDGGMSKRFYAACALMQGLMSNPHLSQEMAKLNTEKVSLVPEIVKAAYEYADELLKQENA